MTKSLLTLASFLIILVGCSGHPSSIVASTSPLPIGVRGSIPAHGNDCQYRLLGLIPVTRSPNAQRALQDAKKSANVTVLTDVTVDENSGYYILFSNRCIHVRGLGVEPQLLETLGSF